MAPLRFSLLILASIKMALAAIGPRADMVIFSDTVSPDGFVRDSIRVSGSTGVNGPLIRGMKGDRFQLNVINNLDHPNMLKATSIHWHGIFQNRGQAWADGPAFVTQCPIAGQGNSFLYDFRVGHQTGTYWYHSHYSSQYCDGLRGPMVIYDRHDPHRWLYDVDNEETVISIADWYHAFARDLVIGVPDATLVNGFGRAIGGNATELAVIHVRPWRRYRLRFVNIACDPFYTISIDGHRDLKFIEVDGVSTRPVVADSFDLFVGQRYSVVLRADQPIGNYWIRVAEFGVPSFEGGINSAILRYIGAPEEEPTTLPNDSTNKLNEQSLTPLWFPGAPGRHEVGAADVVRRLNVSFDGATTRFFINGVTYTPPTLPALLQILSGAATPQSILPEGSYIEVDRNDIVEITIPPLAAGGPHPFHLHGHVFDVIRSANMTDYNFKNPPRRDVVSTGAGEDEVTIRFRADNPGPWFFHCHIEWHLELGFALVIAERANEWDRKIRPSKQWDELCPTFQSLAPEDQ